MLSKVKNAKNIFKIICNKFYIYLNTKIADTRKDHMIMMMTRSKINLKFLQSMNLVNLQFIKYIL